MKNKTRCSTATSHPAARSFFAIGAAVAALVAPALLTGCGSGGGGGGGGGGGDAPSITGKIVNVNAGSAGVAGATVRFAGVSVQTDNNGNFRLNVPENTPAGSATITPPAGTTLYSYASTSNGCANSLSFTVPATTDNDLPLGNIFVYSNDGPPNLPCGI